MPARAWVKLHCERWLKGTLREETRQFRGDWADLLALAGGLSYGEDGIIQLADGVGLSDVQIAGILHVSLADWQATKRRALETDRITVDSRNVITIANWKQYQSEYGRQKDYQKEYRQRKKKQSGVTSHYGGVPAGAGLRIEKKSAGMKEWGKEKVDGKDR